MAALVVIGAGVIAWVALCASPEPASPIAAPSRNGEPAADRTAAHPDAQRYTPETREATEAVAALFSGSGHVSQAWYEPVCDGVLVFYAPVDEKFDTTWFWYDSSRAVVTEQMTSDALYAVLAQAIENFQALKKNTAISMLGMVGGRSKYFIGYAGDPRRYGVSIAYTGLHCGALPDQVELHDFMADEVTVLPIGLEVALGTPESSVLRNTPNTRAALKAVEPSSAFAYDAWEDPNCGGVLVYIQQLDPALDITWHWYDTNEARVTERVTAQQLIAALTTAVPSIVPYRDNSNIHAYAGEGGRRWYVIGSEAESPVDFDVMVGWTSSNCGAIPDVAKLDAVFGPEVVPIDLDLRAEVARLEGHR